METLCFRMHDCKSRYVLAIYKCCLRMDYLKRQNKTKAKERKRKEIKIALSPGYPNSYFYNKRCNMLL